MGEYLDENKWGVIVKRKINEKKQPEAKNADLLDWLLAIDASLR
jgi:hypothetical protein